MSRPPPHPEPDCEALADTLGLADSGPVPAPAPAFRAARFLAVADGLLTRLDALLERGLPRDLNVLAQLGPATNALLLVATASGVALLPWYEPSAQLAWHSLADLGPRSPGGLLRSLHRYSSDLVMLCTLLHALRTLVGHKFADARWLAWVSGVGLLGLVWFIGWTGYWLVWDQRAQLVALDSLKALDALPVFGEPLRRLFALDATVPSLLFFVVFFLHMLLPLGIAGGLCFHLARLSRSRLLPDWRLNAWLGVALLAAALLFPAANAAPAQMALKPDRFGMDWWYLWPLAISSRLGGAGIWTAALLSAAGFTAVPWWLARRRPRPQFQATVNVSRCFACTQCSQDCPFGAITMVPRTDGKPFASQAQVDPDRCIGCGVCTGACDTQGIGLAWFDGQRVTRELEALVTTEVARGAAPALALVCAQEDGGWELFDAAAWARRLPGYHVRPVPCAGWVEPKVLERVIARGAAAVLVVSCGSAEPYCREGNTWLPARLAGTREPEFRPGRADPRKVMHLPFDPLRPQLLAAAAAELLRGGRPAAPPPQRAAAWLAAAALAIAATGVMLWASNAPFRNPAPAEPEFVFTFRANGAWIDAAQVPVAARDDRPIHMRGTLPARRTRAPVVVTVEIDGRREQHTYAPKGLQSDGSSAGEIVVPLTPTTHRVTVTIASGTKDSPSARWDGEVRGQPRRRHVLAYDPVAGFGFHP